jgi:hypothetical protein
VVLGRSGHPQHRLERWRPAVASGPAGGAPPLANLFPVWNAGAGQLQCGGVFNGSIYFSPVADNMQAFRLTNGVAVECADVKITEGLRTSGGDDLRFVEWDHEWYRVGDSGERHIGRGHPPGVRCDEAGG